ncbi:MAG: hypothetical protein JWN49_695 [Parcubacteria group bacterium]|nr:hypothetical protein [Parcubacteria group bacterium]
MKFGRFNPFPSRLEPKNSSKIEPVETGQSYSEADPTLYTQVRLDSTPRESGDVTQTHHKKEIFTDGVNKFVQLEARYDPERQQAIARMLKGIINVADIVSLEGESGKEFYSKVLAHDKIVQKTNHQEIEADIMLLKSVFGDVDRDLYQEQGMKDAEHHNLRIKANAVSYFDFASARFNYQLNPEYLEMHDFEVIDLLESKLDMLEERFKGEEGKQFLNSIIVASGKSLTELFPRKQESASINDFHTMILERIAKAKAVVTQVKQQKLRYKRAA